jgi:hypothetical protein
MRTYVSNLHRRGWFEQQGATRGLYMRRASPACLLSSR